MLEMLHLISLEDKRAVCSRKGMTMNKPGRILLDVVRAYSASLVAVGVSVPIISALVTVGIYIANPQVADLQKRSVSLPAGLILYILGLGLFITGLVWLGSALCCIYLATAQGANMHSYSKIINELYRLKARLGIKNELVDMSMTDMLSAVGMPPPDEHHPRENTHSDIALREAYSYYHSISSDLFGTSHHPSLRTGLRWVLGTGYINVWSLLHKTDEALIEVEPEEAVIHGALNDYLSIQDSTIDNQDKLLSKLIQAVKELDPKAMIYFSEHQPGTNQDIVLEQLALIVKKINHLPVAHAHKNQEDEDDSEEDGAQTVHVNPEARSQARVVLRSVRHALNKFRDDSWEGLVRSRNQLLGTIALTGIITYLLLVIILLSGTSLSIVIAATTFYTVGAVAGLFGRLYRESSSSSSVDDYGLSITRLFATPLLSGLAGVGGAFISVILYAEATNPTIPFAISLKNFSLESGYLFLVAAFFGLTPNLIIKSLQQQAEKYKSDIESSSSANQANRTS
nr:hypothetical protein [Ktedonobacteraceae bacterium]